MARNKHSKKEVEEALQYLEERGWTVKKKRNKGHSWGTVTCPFSISEKCRGGMKCITGVWSTPKNEGNYAKDLRRIADNCVMYNEDDEEDK